MAGMTERQLAPTRSACRNVAGHTQWLAGQVSTAATPRRHAGLRATLHMPGWPPARLYECAHDELGLCLPAGAQEGEHEALAPRSRTCKQPGKCAWELGMRCTQFTAAPRSLAVLVLLDAHTASEDLARGMSGLALPFLSGHLLQRGKHPRHGQRRGALQHRLRDGCREGARRAQLDSPSGFPIMSRPLHWTQISRRPAAAPAFQQQAGPASVLYRLARRVQPLHP